MGLGSFNFALGGYEVRLEAHPWFVSCGLGAPFSDIAAKNVGVCDNDDSDVNCLHVCCCGALSFFHGGVLVDVVEDDGDGFGVGVRYVFDVYFFCARDCSVMSL